MTQQIKSILKEERFFTPQKEFSKNARINSFDEYKKIWHESIANPEKFFSEKAKELLDWHKPFTKVLEWEEPFAKWFSDGKINASYNCLDRHIKSGKGKKTAIYWEGEPGDTRSLNYEELLEEVCRCANGLKELGISKGDRVTIYMPMVPELAISVLACARIGATHSVVFAGFSADALSDRNNDAESKLVITSDGVFRKGDVLHLKERVDESLKKSNTVKKVLVYKRTNTPIEIKEGRDVLWQDLIPRQSSECEPEPLESEHPLFILYTSGSTGKPKGILHTTGGYLLGAALSTQYIFDLKEEDIYWCTADVGWITGHSYIVYGPLANGATNLMYEGAPNTPDPSRFWKLIEKYKVSIFYTAPTAIRAFIKWGDSHIDGHDLSSLRLLGTVGEPINPKAWMWYRDKIGGGKCPIVDTWWQTETGSIMISPLPGATPTIPGTATLPFFGIDPAVVDANGKEVPPNTGGLLVIRKPWPSMLRTIFKDEERYVKTYWDTVKGMYFTGDGARRDEAGNIWIMGRIDDVINVSGHRLSTMEIESALVSHPKVAESAVVGKPDDLKGEAISCFVTLEAGVKEDAVLKKELIEHVVKQIGALARPEEIRFSESLPKTRSGKIMRRFLRDIAAGKQTKQDSSTLEDNSVLDRLREIEL